MRGESPLYVNTPIGDLRSAKRFCGATPGLACSESEDIVYRSGAPGSPSARAVMPAGPSTFILEDDEGKVAELLSRGVAFEDYVAPGRKSANGIAHPPPDKLPQFGDPDGNIPSLVQ